MCTLLLVALLACGDKDGEGSDPTGNQGDGGSDSGGPDSGGDAGDGGDDTDCEALTWFTDADEDGYGDAAAPVEACEQPEGTVGNDRDCDDADPGSWPGAAESCDEADNDCDEAVDEGAADAASWYYDGDGDGYGDPEADTSEGCDAPKGYVADGTDCDDSDPRSPVFVTPGPGSGDGSEGAPFSDLQQAVDSGASCARAEPGSYGPITLKGSTHISISSTGGSGVTTLDAGGSGAVVSVLGDATLVLEGFTLTGGYGYEVSYGSCGYDRCYYHFGGGLYSETAGSVTFKDVILQDMALPHQVDTEGGVETLRYSYGGGIAARSGELYLEDVSLSGLFAVYGGALYLVGVEYVEMTRVQVLDNQGYIGVAYISGSDVYARSLLTSGNGAGYGVFYLESGRTDIAHATFADNYTLTGYTAADIYNARADLTLTNSILAFHSEYGIWDESGFSQVSYTDLYGAGRAEINGDQSIAGSGMISKDPRFSSWTDNDKPDDDLSLSGASPCIDAGDPASAEDADSSPADMGAYGGPDGLWP